MGPPKDEKEGGVEGTPTGLNIEDVGVDGACENAVPLEVGVLGGFENEFL